MGKISHSETFLYLPRMNKLNQENISNDFVEGSQQAGSSGILRVQDEQTMFEILLNYRKVIELECARLARIGTRVSHLSPIVEVLV